MTHSSTPNPDDRQPTGGSEQLSPTGLLLALAQSIGVPADRLLVERAVVESLGGLQDLSAEERAERLTATADRLGLRLRVRAMPLREAWDHVRRHEPVAIGSAAASSDSPWFLARQLKWSQVALTTDSGELVWRPRAELARILGAEHDDALVLTATAESDEAFRSPSVATHGHHGDHGQAHGHGHDHAHHMSPLRRLISVLRPEATDIVYVGIFSAVVGLLGLATPVAVESLVNTVAFGRLLQPIFILCLLLLTFLMFAAALRVLQAYVAELIQQRIFVRVVADLAHRLPRVQYRSLTEQNGPELLNRFFDVMTVQKSAALLVLDGVAIVLQTIIGMAVLAFYHPYLLGFNLFLVTCVAFIVFVLGHGAVRTAIDESIAKYAVAAWLEELACFPVTFKSSGGPRRAMELADRLTSNYLRSRRQHFRILLRQVVFTVGLQAMGSAMLLGLGGWLVVNGQLTLGQLVAAELIVAVLLGSFAKLGKQMESFYDLLAAVDKLGHLFDLPVERSNGATPAEVTTPARLRVRGLEYSFDDGVEKLSGLTFDVAPGELVALTGGPGAGKSLVLDMLYGLREPSAGRIEFDGVDLRSLQPAALRRSVALVREREVFSGTIAENVHVDRSDVDLAAVRGSLEEIGLLDELLDLPDGLETAVQLGGTPLSESQARRLVLARALAGSPRLILIDGLLDTLADHRLTVVLAALRRWCQRATIIVATGRGDIAAACDRRVPLAPDSFPEATRSEGDACFAAPMGGV